MSLVEQSLPVQLVLQLFKGHIQIPHAVRRQLGAVELIGPVPWEHADAAIGDDLHPVLRPEPQLHGAALEHDAPQSALPVLQGEVVMPGGVYLIVGQLPPDVDAGELRDAVDDVFDEAVDLRYGIDLAFHRFLLSQNTVQAEQAHLLCL